MAQPRENADLQTVEQLDDKTRQQWPHPSALTALAIADTAAVEAYDVAVDASLSSRRFHSGVSAGNGPGMNSGCRRTLISHDVVLTAELGVTTLTRAGRMVRPCRYRCRGKSVVGGTAGAARRRRRARPH